MTSTQQIEKYSEEYNFHLNTHELSTLRDLVRKAIEGVPVTQLGGRYHEMYEKIYSKLCKAYITQPEITQ